MGRQRGGRFADRPENIELSTVGGVTYFKYVFPDGRTRAIGNSRDVQAAFDTARAMNGHFASQRTGLDELLTPKAAKPTARNPLIKVLIGEFRLHDPKRKAYAERTRSEQDFRLNVYAKTWADKTVGDIATIDVAKELNKLSDNAYVKHRADLYQLFQFAGHQGYISVNPVAITLAKKEAKKIRQRHTLEGFNKILKAAEGDPFLHRAMRIALYSLQRRDDLVRLHKVDNKVDLTRNSITILQRKTRNYKNPVWIEIDMGSELRAAVEECLRSPILCPYLIHRRPGKMPKKGQLTKLHPFAVTPAYLSKEFTRVRDACGAYADMKPEERPTLHELRALGTHLYEQAGYSDEYIMALTGHAKMETLDRYKRDHAVTSARKVSAGISGAQLQALFPQNSPKIPPN